MKELQLLQICPNSIRFWWETFVQLSNFREYGYSKLANVIVFLPQEELKMGFNVEWEALEQIFPETKFHFYKDTEEGRTARLIKAFGYIPMLRLTCMERFFEENPRIKENGAIFYHDADILFTRYLDFEKFLQDDICYLSDTKSYINSEYFDGKIRDVLPEKQEAYLKEDVLNKCAKICKTTRAVCEENKNKSGGAQYLLKGEALTQQFWTNVLNSCAGLRIYLMDVNSRYFPGDSYNDKENKGIQRWCSDMFSLLFNLWSNGLQTTTPPELDFAWATDDISRLDEVYIYHNAGVTSDAKLKRKTDKQEIEAPVFFKGASYFISQEAITPFSAEYQPILQEILSNPISQTFAISRYAKEIEKVKQIYNL